MSRFRHLLCLPCLLAGAVLLCLPLLLLGSAGGQGKFALAQTTGAALLPETPWSYDTEPVALAQFLDELALSFGVELRSESLPNATVAGQARAANGQALLDRLAEEYGFAWYRDGGLLVVAGTRTQTTQTFTFESAAAKARFLEAARRRTTPAYGVNFDVAGSEPTRATLQGPASWLALLDGVHAQLHAGTAGSLATTATSGAGTSAESEVGVMVFSLRHAWAEDKTLALGETSTTLPGIATLLSDLSGVAAQSGTGSEGTATALGAAGAPLIRADPRLNAVLVRDLLVRRAYYEELIASLDRPVRMVQLEAYIFDVSRSRLDDLGVQWLSSDNDSAVSFGDPLNPSEGTPALIVGTHDLRARVSDRNGVLARIAAIEDEGEGEILSRPSVLTLNNHEAIFNSSQRFYVRVESQQDAQLFPVSTKTELRVTPRIVGGGTPEDERIHLLIAITDGSIDNKASAQVDNLPRINESFISTQGVVADGESLLIGGQITSRARVLDGGVPLLKDLPILGFAFSRNSETQEALVRVFMLTPRIETLDAAGGAVFEGGDALREALREQGVQLPDAPEDAPAEDGAQ